MGHAYTPGLKVTEELIITKKRILPLKGDVLVKVSEVVGPDTVVARTHLPGPVEPENVANILGVAPADVPAHMTKKAGDRVEKGEVIASAKTFFGLFKTECKAKMTGTIENISSVTGQVLLRGEPVPVEVKAYLPGEVVEIFPKEGVALRAVGAFVQGIFGIGGETHGELKVVVPDRKTVLSEDLIDSSSVGKIIVGGSLVTAAALRKAIAVKAAAVVVGGFDDKDLRDFLGYDLGVAITGSEELGVTLVVTEGFGQIDMAEKTFNLLKKFEGKLALANGATQIRAGVIRPEVIIPLSQKTEIGKEEKFQEGGLAIGSPVRVIRSPYFGRLGKVVDLPAPLQKLESESSARILVVEFDDRSRATVPRANVEMIEG